jgi:hypothetical protein
MQCSGLLSTNQLKWQVNSPKASANHTSCHLMVYGLPRPVSKVVVALVVLLKRGL